MAEQYQEGDITFDGSRVRIYCAHPNYVWIDEGEKGVCTGLTNWNASSTEVKVLTTEKLWEVINEAFIRERSKEGT